MSVHAQSRGARASGAPSTCPYCGQPLLDHEAIKRLEESERRAQVALNSAVQREAKALAKKLAAANEKKVADLQARLSGLQASHRQELRDAVIQERAKAQAEASRAAEVKVAKDLKQKGRALKRFQEQIDLQQRQIEHLTADERGDMNEEALLSDLRAAFPDDQLERLGRGRAGGDILHRVCVRAGDGLLAEAGLIVYECKDTLSWGTNFLEQARKEGLRHKTPYLVIISRAFPRGQKMLCVKDGVVVVHPSRAVDLAHVMRRMVEEVHRAALTAADQATKSVELISYLGSPDFRQAFETLISSSEKLTGLLGKERDWHERTWSKRQAAYDEIRARTSAVDARIRAIIEKEPAKNGKVVALRRTATPSAVGR